MANVREELWRPGDGPGLPVVTLEVDGARCRIAPQLGFNCLSWEVETPLGWRERLWTAKDVDVNPVSTRSGVPLLFPFPNRIRGGQYTWGGKHYQLPLNSQGTNAIHGFACYRPWRVEQVEQGRKSQVLVAGFESRNFPELRGTWPSEYQCTARYTLTRKDLTLDFEVTNVGDAEMPFGFGTHAYWRCNVAKVRLRPFAQPKVRGELDMQAWVLQDLLPTGEFRPLTPEEEKARNGTELGDAVLDTALQVTDDIAFGMGWIVSEEVQGHEMMLLLHSGDEYRTFVLFTPPHRGAVCVEPYTCTTDAVNLQPRGVQTGLLTVQPGESWRTRQKWDHACRPVKR